LGMQRSAQHQEKSRFSSPALLQVAMFTAISR
jgi:hypothetical protein